MAAPAGNKNATKNRPWTDAIRRAIAQRNTANGKDTLFELATAMLDSALGGEKEARDEIANRLDGKPVQSQELSGPDGGAIEYSDATKEELEAKIREYQAKPHIRAIAGGKL